MDLHLLHLPDLPLHMENGARLHLPNTNLEHGGTFPAFTFFTFTF